MTSRRRRRRAGDIENLAEAFDNMRSDYAAAKSSRFRRRRTGVPAVGGDADYHYRSESDYLKMMEYARDMDRNDAVIGQGVDRAVSNMLQDGLRLNPSTGDKGIDAENVARWQEWSVDDQQCDLAGEDTFWDFEYAAARSCFIDGDIVVLPTDTGALQLVEAHRLRTPKNAFRRKKVPVHGVVMDDRRRRTEYWLTTKNLDPWEALHKISDVTKYPAYQKDAATGELHKAVLHVILSKKRYTQTRGVTALAPIFDHAGMYEDINFAELVHQQVATCFAIFHERELDWRDGEMPQTGDRETETMASGETRLVEGISPGMRIAGLPGEKLRMDSPNIPSPEFFRHMEHVLTMIGINLGLPLMMLLMDSTKSNFSAWRGAVDQARIGFRTNQRRLANRLHRPVYRWKVRQWMADDSALRNAHNKPGVDVFRHSWGFPTWPYIEPLKDATADALRARTAQSSPRRLCAERNTDWEEIAAEIPEDNGLLIEGALKKATELNKKFPGASVTWREVAMLPVPEGMIIRADSSATEPASKEPEK